MTRSHLDGVDQVVHQEEAPQFTDGPVCSGQEQVAVLVDHVLRQRHLTVQVHPERDSRGPGLIQSWCVDVS